MRTIALLFGNDKIGSRMLLFASSIELLCISSSNSNWAACYLLRITSSSFCFFPIAFILLPSFFSYQVAAFVLLPVFVSIKQLPVACISLIKLLLACICFYRVVGCCLLFLKIELLPTCVCLYRVVGCRLLFLKIELLPSSCCALSICVSFTVCNHYLVHTYYKLLFAQIVLLTL